MISLIQEGGIKLIKHWMIREKEEAAIDKEFYDIIFEKCPDIAPKSFNGYRRMKATNSSNYQKILIEAEKRLGYNFYNR